MNDSPIKLLLLETEPGERHAWREIIAALDRQRFVLEPVSDVPTPAVPAAVSADAILLRPAAQGEDAAAVVEHLHDHILSHVPIIVLGPGQDEPLAINLLRAGASDYLGPEQASVEILERTIFFAVERNRSKRALLENEARYRTLFKNAGEAAYIATVNGVFVDINQAALDLFGYAPNEIRALKLKELYVDPAAYEEVEQAVAESGTIKDYEVKLRRKDGKEMDCLLNLSVRRARDGRILEYQALIREITTRKALEETWRHYEFIVNNSKEFMTLMNRNYIYEAVNESYCRAHGKSRDEIVGKTVAQVWGESAYLYRIKKTLEQCFAGEEVYFQGWLGFSAIGERYMHVTYYPYHNAEGVVSHIVVVSRDVTERKLAEEALHQAHSQNEQLLASIPSILIGVDSDDHITHLNRPAEEAFGIPASEAVGTPFRECQIEWDWNEILSRVHEGRRTTSSVNMRDVKYTRADGKEGFLDLAVNPFVGELGKEAGFLLIGEDVTERKILEGQLSQAQKLESIGQLAAGIAHEINTPTQYVGDNIRFLQESFTDMFDLFDSYQAFIEAARAGKITPDAVAELEELQEEADMEFLVEEIPTAIAQSLEGVERVSGIVRAMKEFSHPGVEQKTAIDINKAIESTITVARNEWKYVADMETVFDPNLPPVPCLPGEFNQAILNMIINAAHAIGDVVGNGNGSGEKGKITIQTQRDQGWVEIRISDTGTGIPEGARAKIFDPFFTTKEVGHGTGQGLSIAHAVIVEKHDGAVTFETESGRGTTFFIRMPLDIHPEKSVAYGP